ncbi:hypothetical protein FNF27_07393 [Cafeteria roenbergensis]|uniref:Rhodanese domain-containing protein n=1 Tax=Cafeteria roenbergensis TaxID=33653 RepID=A0A5A8DNQ6_CAFRO|nr:hypothetical protein FNF27_07393 [Cafeteria roenbergensis]
MNGNDERSCTKTYLVADKYTKRAVIVDPVKEHINRYLGVLSYYGCTLDAAIDTHTHADHITCLRELKALTGSKSVMSQYTPNPYIDHYVHDGDVFRIGGVDITLMHTPGHTRDHLALYDGEHVMTGDVLLIGGTGRTDFAGGNASDSYRSITEKLFALPDETVVLPGHDYRGNTKSTIGEEKASNPRLAGKTEAEYVHIMDNLGLPLPEKIMEAIQVNAAAFDDDKGDLPLYSHLAAVRQVTPQQLFDATKGEGWTDRLAVLDVREPAELEGPLGALPGAVNIPVQSIVSRIAELDPFRCTPVVVVCRAGIRSTSAAAILTGLGFGNVKNLTGGMVAYREAGF